MSGKLVSKLEKGFGKSRKVGKAKAAQVGAICTRKKAGKLEVLLVTSRGTKRWVIPKGWQMDGLSDSQAATVEAWEEAGVSQARVDKIAIGKYKYPKDLGKGKIVETTVSVFRLKVMEMKKKFPEYRQRKHTWVSPKKASKLVAEPGLKKLLMSLRK